MWFTLSTSCCHYIHNDHHHVFILLRTVPFKSVGGRRNGRFSEGGEGPNSELVYTIRVYMISGRRGRGVSNF